MELKTEIVMMLHEGGTKFYEVAKFYNHDGKRFVVVNRWGKKSEQRGGGQTKVEAFSGEYNANEAARKKMAEKQKRGYQVVMSHDTIPRNLDSDIVRLKLNEHYNDSDVTESVMHHLALTDILTEASKADLDHLFGRDNIVVEEPEPKVERGGDWASW